MKLPSDVGERYNAFNKVISIVTDQSTQILIN